MSSDWATTKWSCVFGELDLSCESKIRSFFDLCFLTHAHAGLMWNNSTSQLQRSSYIQWCNQHHASLLGDRFCAQCSLSLSDQRQQVNRCFTWSSFGVKWDSCTVISSCADFWKYIISPKTLQFPLESVSLLRKIWSDLGLSFTWLKKERGEGEVGWAYALYGKRASKCWSEGTSVNTS